MLALVSAAGEVHVSSLFDIFLGTDTARIVGMQGSCVFARMRTSISRAGSHSLFLHCCTSPATCSGALTGRCMLQQPAGAHSKRCSFSRGRLSCSSAGNLSGLNASGSGRSDSHVVRDGPQAEVTAEARTHEQRARNTGCQVLGVGTRRGRSC
jgi:hypothetical protein